METFIVVLLMEFSRLFIRPSRPAPGALSQLGTFVLQLMGLLLKMSNAIKISGHRPQSTCRVCDSDVKEL